MRNAAEELKAVKEENEYACWDGVLHPGVRRWLITSCKLQRLMFNTHTCYNSLLKTSQM